VFVFTAAPSAAINRQRRRVRGILKCYCRSDLASLFRDRTLAVAFFNAGFVFVLCALNAGGDVHASAPAKKGGGLLPRSGAICLHPLGEMLGVISSWPTAADKRDNKGYRATHDENNCDPK